ncbi:hypothetical protein E2C01_026495 [Portunus trituberculatus]|uniref:Uncharacterized protein n=1 Tax=Portunus trituberculatus TaxID=210409 RepID=A0A5B7EG23_PORTR|nr:hypothetical protein [Portunus trituberculatus]
MRTQLGIFVAFESKSCEGAKSLRILAKIVIKGRPAANGHPQEQCTRLLCSSPAKRAKQHVWPNTAAAPRVPPAADTRVMINDRSTI